MMGLMFASGWSSMRYGSIFLIKESKDMSKSEEQQKFDYAVELYGMVGYTVTIEGDFIVVRNEHGRTVNSHSSVDRLYITACSFSHGVVVGMGMRKDKEERIELR